MNSFHGSNQLVIWT